MDLLFADDVVLCGQTREESEGRLETWRREMEDREMKVSRPKTEYLCLSEQDAAGAIQMQGEDVNRVKQFQYLGSIVQAGGGSEKEVMKRVQAGWGMAWKKITGLCVTRR